MVRTSFLNGLCTEWIRLPCVQRRKAGLLYFDFSARPNGLDTVVIHGRALNGRQLVGSQESRIATESEGFRLVLCQTEININPIVPDVGIFRSLPGMGMAGQPVIDDFKT